MRGLALPQDHASRSRQANGSMAAEPVDCWHPGAPRCRGPPTGLRTGIFPRPREEGSKSPGCSAVRLLLLLHRLGPLPHGLLPACVVLTGPAFSNPLALCMGSMFEDPDFDPERYTKGLFRTHLASHVKALRSDLEKKLAASAAQLQECVFSNYSVFIATSRGMAFIDKELTQLENRLNDLHTLIRPIKIQEHPPAVLPPDEEGAGGRGAADGAGNHPAADGDGDNDGRYSDEDGSYSGSNNDDGDEDGNRASDGHGRRRLSQAGSQPSGTAATLSRETEEAVNLFDIALSKRSFEECLVLYDQGGISPARLEHLAELMIDELSRSGSKRLVLLVCRAGKQSIARDTFLLARSTALRQEIRYIRFSGDVGTFAEDLSFLVFTTVGETADDFQELFEDGYAATAFFIEWAAAELEKFTAIFDAQIFGAADFQSVARCVAIAQQQCKVLEKRGMSFGFHLTRLFLPRLREKISSYFKELTDQLLKLCAGEPWSLKEMFVSSNRLVILSDSGLWLYSVCERLVADVRKLSWDVMPVVTDGLTSLLKIYFHSQIAAKIQSGALRDKQIAAALTTAEGIWSHLLPYVDEQLRTGLTEQLTARVEADLIDSFASAKARSLAVEKLVLDGSDDGRSFQQLLVYLAKLGALFEQSLSPNFCKLLMQRLCAALWNLLPKSTMREQDLAFVRSFLHPSSDDEPAPQENADAFLLPLLRSDETLNSAYEKLNLFLLAPMPM